MMQSLKRVALSHVPDYASVTETPSIRITREAMAMQASRYAFAASLCAGKDVLEVACGTGSGLGNFARAGATSVIGGDYTENLVVHAARHYRGRLNMLRLDAQALPFRSQSFDLIVLFEAIYYLRNPSLSSSKPAEFCGLMAKRLYARSILNGEATTRVPSALTIQAPKNLLIRSASVASRPSYMAAFGSTVKRTGRG